MVYSASPTVNGDEQGENSGRTGGSLHSNCSPEGPNSNVGVASFVGPAGPETIVCAAAPAGSTMPHAIAARTAARAPREMDQEGDVMGR
jgi:hypothetical protein